MKKTARIACAFFASVILLAHLCVFAGVENGEAVVVLDSVSGLPGQSVDVNMTLTKNPGITGLRFKVAYDQNRLTLEKAVYTKIGGGGLIAVNIKNNPVVLLWNVSLYEFTETGVLATLTFKIKEGTAVGDVPLKVTYGRGDCIDYDLNNLTMDITNGNVHIDYDGTNCEHKSTSTTVTKDPSCTEAGAFKVSCDVCSTTLTSGDLARSEHSYGPLIVTKEPTYTEIGLKEQKCSVCGDVRTEPIDLLDPPDTEDTEDSTPAVTDTQTSVETETDSLTQPDSPSTEAPIETSPATGDDTMLLAAICTVSLVMVVLLVISKIKDRRKFRFK